MGRFYEAREPSQERLDRINKRHAAGYTSSYVDEYGEEIGIGL